MFTGIVEHIGVVSSVEKLDQSQSGGNGTSIRISQASPILSDCHLGDSISVNGVCLTVTEFDSDSFKVGVAPETLRRTNLGTFQVGSTVNLERAALAASTSPSSSSSLHTHSTGTRLGGHIVQGHVDTVAVIEKKELDGNSLRIRFRPRKLPRLGTESDVDRSILRHVIEKGFITLDGTSLTITRVCDWDPLPSHQQPPRSSEAEGEEGLDVGWFEVMLVAYTQEKVVQAKKDIGESVNVEVDMAAKYIDKSVRAYFDDAVRKGSNGKVGDGAWPVLEKMVSRIVDQKLAERK